MDEYKAFSKSVFHSIPGEHFPPGRRTLNFNEIQSALKLVLPGELAKHAVQDGAKAVSLYLQNKAFDEAEKLARAAEEDGLDFGDVPMLDEEAFAAAMARDEAEAEAAEGGGEFGDADEEGFGFVGGEEDGGVLGGAGSSLALLEGEGEEEGEEA